MTGSVEDSGGNPSLSIIVIAFNGSRCLTSCLDSLDAQVGSEAEVIIVSRCPAAEELTGKMNLPLCTRFPGFIWLIAGETANVPQMRGLGMAQARGTIIALLEDDCIVPPAWSTAIVQAHLESAAVAIGGAVEPGNYEHLTDWAVFFAEYGARFLRPLPGNGVSVLPGTNVSYKTWALETVAMGQDPHENRGAFARRGFYEVFEHSRLQEAGYTLELTDGLVVHNVNSWSFVPALAARYHHGRGYAAMRLKKTSWWNRIPWMAAALLLPALQLFRIGSDIVKKRRFLRRFLCATPALLLCAACWSIGEFMGYGFGPGRSLDCWR